MVEWRRDEFVVSTDRQRLDVDAVVHFLAEEAYWAKGRGRDVVERSIAGSLVFGMYDGQGRQVGFARVVTDQATFAWLCDVFILPVAQGRGLGTWLMGCVVAHPELQGLRRWLLGTQDAHGLYRKFGFTELQDASRYMVRQAASSSVSKDEHKGSES